MKTLVPTSIENRMVSPMNLTWESIRSRAIHWISDFEFFYFEIVFLQHLLAKTTVWFTSQKNDHSVRELARKLENLELRRNLFVRVIRYHLMQVESMIEDPFSHDGQTIKDDHKDLERRIIEFNKELRIKKLAVYLLVEGTVNNEKIRHLLDPTSEEYFIEPD